MNKKILTIVFPSYNRENELLRRLHEISDLNYVSILVIDDFSKTKYDLSKYNVEVLRNSRNLGRGNSIIRAINFVKTEFVSFFDDDDPIFIDNVKKVIKILKKLNEKYVGLIAETDQNDNELLNQFESYLIERFNKKWKDRKEFVRTSILKKSIPFWLKARRIPTSFLFSLCDRKGKFWKYSPLVVVNKIYMDGGMTEKIKKNPFKKSMHITVIYWIYRKFKILKYELF